MTWSMICRILGGVILLLVLASIADSLIRPGPRCGVCGGQLLVTAHRDDDKMEVTFYECVKCGGLSFDQRFKLGAAAWPAQVVGHLPQLKTESSADILPLTASASP